MKHFLYKTIINMATMQNREIISDKFNVMGICTSANNSCQLCSSHWVAVTFNLPKGMKNTKFIFLGQKTYTVFFVCI
jgi:hypothetical protein